MRPGPEAATIFRIARLYYEESLSQEEIAGREGLSRSQISRLIVRARELGFVRITLVPPSCMMSGELAEALRQALGLRSVTVVPLRDGSDPAAVSDAIATGAADMLKEILDGQGTVGLGWGRTVYRTSELLSSKAVAHPPRFVPLIGISGDDNPNLQINTIIDRFGRRFGSSGMFVNIPAIRDKGAVLSRIEESRKEALELQWRQMDAAVIGLGDPPATSANLLAELPRAYLDELAGSGACGDILAQFFDDQGRILDQGAHFDLLALELGALKKLRQVICLAGGSGKKAGIVTAARCGYFTDLVIDEPTALAIRNEA